MNETYSAYLLREDVIGCGEDVGHEGAVLNIFVVTDDMNGVVASLRGPIAHIAGAVALVVTLDLSLGWAFDGKAWKEMDNGNRFPPLLYQT